MLIHKFCENCKTQQIDKEKQCLKCGAPYGGELWPLLTWAALIIIPAMVFILGGRLNELLDLRIFFWYVLPATLGAAFLYDHHPARCAIYFYGGAIVIITSVIILSR